MSSRQLTVTSLLLVLLIILTVASAFAATQAGSLTSGQFAYYDITLPTPQSGMRLVLSTSASSSIYLYTGTDHTVGSQIAASYNQNLHTLLVAPGSLTDGAGYHVRIYADANLTYSFTDDLKFISSTLAWDTGATIGGASIITQPDTAGGDYLFKITAQSPVHPGWRNVLKVNSGEADLYLQQGSAPVTGGSYSSANVGSDVIYLNADASLAGQQWYIRVHATPGSIWQLASGDLYVQDLTWDTGSAPGGTSTISQPATIAGDYFFRITSQTPSTGAWRSVLNVLGGEADFYLQQGSVPFGDTYFKSTAIGSDGLILAANQYSNNQTWYIRVHAAGVTSSWNIFSGEIYAQDIGMVGDTSSIPAATIGPEGTYYYKANVDATTKAWRLWLSGGNQAMWVMQATAPVKTAWNEQAEQFEAGQMLLVPPYLTNAVYFIGVTGAPGSSITLDSRRQQVTTLSFAGNTTNTVSGYGYGYTTYRVDVPIDQIAWQINLTPGLAGQNPELYIRSGDIPNRWTNSALSEAPAGVIDSITQVPPTLTDGTWYITVYGSGSFSYNLTNGIPVVTGKPFINTSDPNPVPPGYAYPYNTVPITNDDSNRSGWRYYQVSDINSQLGFLGWQLDLDAAHQAGREIALRRNAVPARWSYRNGNSAYNSNVSESYHMDATSNYGFLQHPGHQADIWYIGINTPNQAMGPFQLTTREIPAPLKQVNNSSTAVSSQIANTWQWFKFTAPSSTDPNNAKYEPNFLGWDLRLKATGGNPRMVVRRDQLPADFNTQTGYYSGSLDQMNNWQTGWQWSPGIGDSQYNYYSYSGGFGGPTGRYAGDKNSYLIVGLGSPLEAGTYYVGVSGDGSDTTPLSYTLESRGIGIGNDAGGSPWPIQVQDLGNFAGGSVNRTGLTPREAAYYRVTVPAGAKSWSMKLEPTLGEALMTIHQGSLPNMMAHEFPSDSPYNYSGNRRQKDGREFFYKYAESPQTAITTGTYYIAVFSEGQNPPDSYTIGSGGVSYTLTSIGEMPVADKTATPAAVGTPVAWTGETLQYGQQKVYRFRVPAGLTSMEVRLKNVVGGPNMALRQDAAGSGMIPSAYSPTYIAHEGGYASTWYNDTLITVPQPAAGDYTLTVAAKSLYGPPTYITTYPDAACDVEVRAQTPATLILDNGSASASLVDKQIQYYQVTIPATVNGYPLAGWKIGTAATNGSAKLYISKNGVPNAPSQPTLEVTSPFAVLTAPYLEPGTWYIAVQGVGITDYTITSEIISADPARNRRSWTMPAKGGSFTQAGLTSPWIGDSGIDNKGIPIINPSTGDQGTDLGQDDWHFYRITVPDTNGGILKTVLEALSGKPELYIRKGGVPSPYHRSDAIDPMYYYAPYAYDRSQTLTGTMYGNWVPLDRRTETQLSPGDWWLGIKAVNSNIRYRLKVAAGNVRNTTGPLDSSGYFQDLDLTSGSTTGQTLAAGDIRYYRVTIPQSSTTLASSTPTAWNLTLAQQVGAVGIIIRDTIPPGTGTDGNNTNLSYFVDWGKDNSYLNPNPYITIDAPGTTTIPTPPMRPGATYYLGVYATTDATFDLSSGIGAERLKLDGIIPFANGTLSTTLAAGEQRLYRIDVPADALLWHHTAQHDGGIRLYLAQGTVPPKDGYAHWSTYGNADSSLNQNLSGYPWQPGYDYYLVVENTTGGPLPFSFTMNGKSTLSRLSLSITATCPGSSVTTSPDVFTCTSGSCSADIMPYTTTYLYANPGSGCALAGWTGACASSGNNWYCTLPMDQSATTAMSFVDVGAPAITFSLPSTSTTSNVAVTFSATDNMGVTGYCLSESDSSSGCAWSSTPPTSYTFSGLADNTPTWRYLYAFARDSAGNIATSYAYTTITITVTDANLSVTLTGSGDGAVNSNPSGLTCTTGTCSRNYTLNSTVSLLTTPSVNSTFGGWSGDCSGTGACSVTMNSAKKVTATFTADPAKVKIDGVSTLYYAIAAALNAVPAQDRTVRALAQAFVGDVIMTSPVTILFRGGYTDPSFIISPVGTNVTTIDGSLRLRSGTLKVQRLIIR